MTEDSHPSIAARYRDAVAALWRRREPDFIATQSFRRLLPDGNGEVMRYLHPRWFLPGKKHHEGARGASWEPVSREELLVAARARERPGSLVAPLRMMLVAGGGVGKSTNLQWLETRLNADGTWAILVGRGDITDRCDLFSAAVRRVARLVPGVTVDEVANQLGELGKGGRLIVLVDHLDQVRAGDDGFAFLRELPASCSRCGLVLAGRPTAVQGWTDSPDADAIDARDWQFIEPLPFTDAEAERFTDHDGVSRYRLARRQLGPHCSVPRVLQFLRRLNAEEIRDLTTPAELYECVVRKVVANEKSITQGNGHAAVGVDRATCLLSALAFVSWNGTRTNEDFVLLTLNPDIKNEVLDRVRSQYKDYTEDQLRADLRVLTKMVLLISDASPEPDAHAMIEWSSRTIVEFLACWWLACHAGRFVRPSGDRPDVSSLPVFYPEDGDYVTYEINQFLADFPAHRLAPSSWVECARCWYDPGTPETYRTRRWSAEMLYRSWRTMHAIAGRPVHDWWDVPYHRLVVDTAGQRGADAAGALPRTQCDPETARRAGEVLDAFFGDLQRLLESDDGQLRSAAQDLVAETSWCEVPTGQFCMGAPPGRQGFPGKLERFWRRELGKVQIGWIHEDPCPTADGKPPRFRKAGDDEDVAQRAAEWLTKKEWFTGLSGEQLRKDDIRWLKKVLASIRRRDTVDMNAPDYKDAYEKIERKWRKRDEVPLDPEPQHVAAFTMQRLPVLHKWFGLFAPAHREAVAKYLAALDGTRHPPEDHPVIYVGWFDAWAFCQWATWRVPDRPGHVYKLRLPHEPEWEYAVRWRVQDGQLVQTPMTERYWWGDSFYANEEIPEDTTPRKAFEDFAHVNGKPGSTRASKELNPNGLGLHDMLGNVWEWMANVYDVRTEEEIVDAEARVVQSGQDMVPIGYSRFAPGLDQQPLVNALRPMRGGLWYYLDLLATCTSRYRLTSDDDRDYKMGFRVVREEWQGDVRCSRAASDGDDRVPALPPAPPLATAAVASAPVPRAPRSAADGKHPILFLAANPIGIDQLALDDEAEIIREELKRSDYKDRFHVIERPRTKSFDLLRQLRDLRPTIVHFSGHGGRRASGDRLDPCTRTRDIRGPTGTADGASDPGLFVLAPDGSPKFISARALAQTFHAAGASVKVVILNACYTDEQAALLVEHVDCVVGMSGAVLDEVAISFARGFYGGIGAGDSVATAYEQGRAAIHLMGLPGEPQLKLERRAGVDAEHLVLVDRRPYTGRLP